MQNARQIEPDQDTVIAAPPTRRRSVPAARNKADSAFRTISEVADTLKVPQHVLRFWETKFSQIRPLKRGGGRRYYRPEDVALLARVHELLYSEGYTIKGVQKLLKGQGKIQIVTQPRPPAPLPIAVPADESVAVVVDALPEISAPAALVVVAPVMKAVIGSDIQREILRGLLDELKTLRHLIRV